MKNDAYKHKVYAGLMRGFEEARAHNLVGEDARAAALNGVDAFLAERRARAEAEHARQKQITEARAARAKTNAFLKEHGYRWYKIDIGTEDVWAGFGSLGAGIGEADSYQWELIAPDGRMVTEAEAKAEIVATTLGSH